MCGIYCELCTGPKSQFCIETDEQLKMFLNQRGPDSYGAIATTLPGCHLQSNMMFYGAVLWMQGDSLTPQPLEDECGILIYNGDIFDISWDKKVSDTLLIMNKLGSSVKNTCSDRKENIIRKITTLKGPFSMVYYDKIEQLLYFARDAIGRNSMLFYRNESKFIISSVLGRKYKGTVEVPALNIYVMNLRDFTISIYDRNTLVDPITCSVESWTRNLQEHQSMSDEMFLDKTNDDINVMPEDVEFIQLIETISANIKCRKQVMSTLLQNKKIETIVRSLTDLLKASVEIRLDRQPYKCQECVRTSKGCSGHCTVGVLFSGGLDCTVLALLADDYVPKDEPIDLINVAFKRGENGTFDVPDRLTGRLALDELRHLRPARKWLFREVNVCEEELRRERDGTVADLVHPRRTVLDESLGAALWFAARATDHTTTSTCRVVLLGSGADELFGGYTRHRNALRRGSWNGLNKELLLDWRRISSRNLARDSRVIGHHGRQPRMPYLDEHFTRYVLQLKPWERCIPSTACGPGLGDKLCLRLLAFQLGLRDVSSLPKRALQFGSRIANKKENGADVSERFKNL